MSGFQHEPGSPERRQADRELIERKRTAPVKNPRRYNVDNEHAFGIARLAENGSVTVHVRGGGPFDEEYDRVEAMLDDGWTVD